MAFSSWVQSPMPGIRNPSPLLTTLESGQPAVEAGGQDLMESKMMYLEVTLFSSLSETGAR